MLLVTFCRLYWYVPLEEEEGYFQDDIGKNNNFRIKSLLYYVSEFFMIWTLITSILPVYFCSCCHILNQTLLEMRKKHHLKSDINVENYYIAYDKITDLISNTNDIFHNVLLINLPNLLGWIYYQSYYLIFMNEIMKRDKIYRCLCLISIYIKLLSICLYSPSVTKTASEVKNLLFY